MSINNSGRKDARIIKTRAKLFSSFTTLLSEKQFEEITINEICDHAKVRRATFYKHFRDKYDFLRSLTVYTLRGFEAQVTEQNYNKASAEYYIDFLRKLIHYMLDNEKTMKLILNSDMQATLIDIMMKEIYHYSLSWLADAEKSGVKLIASTEKIATMLSGGIATIIIKWFISDKNETPTELCREISALVRAMFI